DQLVWRPLLAWADRFKLELVESAEAPQSWFYDALRASQLFAWIRARIHDWLGAHDTPAWAPAFLTDDEDAAPTGGSPLVRILWIVAGVGLVYGMVRAVIMLAGLTAAEWVQIGLGALATLLRVATTLVIALVWTVPFGVAIGFSRAWRDG